MVVRAARCVCGVIRVRRATLVDGASSDLAGVATLLDLHNERDPCTELNLSPICVRASQWEDLCRTCPLPASVIFGVKRVKHRDYFIPTSSLVCRLASFPFRNLPAQHASRLATEDDEHSL